MDSVSHGGVDSVDGVHRVSNDGGVHSVVDWGMDSVSHGGVDSVDGVHRGMDSVSHRGVDSVADNSGSVMGGEVAGRDDGSSVADGGVVSHVSAGGGGGKAEKGGDNESLHFCSVVVY